MNTSNGITIIALTESMTPAELLTEVVSTFLSMSVGALAIWARRILTG